MADLHKTLAVDKSTTTRLINPMVDQGLVMRHKSEQDSRAINLSLTREGQELHRKVWECLSGFMEGFLQRIPDEERQQVLKATKTFMNALKEASDQRRR